MITGIGTPSNQSRSPRPIISSSKYIEEKTRDVTASSCAEKNPARRNVLGFRNFRERQSNPKQRIAVAVDRLAHLGIDVVSMAAARQPPFAFTRLLRKRRVRARHEPIARMADVHEEVVQGLPYQWPVFGIEVHGSAGGFGSPFCKSSIECRSGERTKAMLPSRGGRLMVMPAFIRRSQVA